MAHSQLHEHKLLHQLQLLRERLREVIKRRDTAHKRGRLAEVRNLKHWMESHGDTIDYKALADHLKEREKNCKV